MCDFSEFFIDGLGMGGSCELTMVVYTTIEWTDNVTVDRQKNVDNVLILPMTQVDNWFCYWGNSLQNLFIMALPSYISPSGAVAVYEAVRSQSVNEK